MISLCSLGWLGTHTVACSLLFPSSILPKCWDHRSMPAHLVHMCVYWLSEHGILPHPPQRRLCSMSGKQLEWDPVQGHVPSGVKPPACGRRPPSFPCTTLLLGTCFGVIVTWISGLVIICDLLIFTSSLSLIQDTLPEG